MYDANIKSQIISTTFLTLNRIINIQSIVETLSLWHGRYHGM